MKEHHNPFWIPQVLISDNGTQFNSGPFKKFCEQYGIRNHFSTPAYPQGNGHAESSNKMLLNGIKKRLEKAKGRWVEELPSILWTYRTIPRSSTGETSFSLTYRVEAVIPLEIGLPTIHTEYYDPVTNETSLATDWGSGWGKKGFSSNSFGCLPKRASENV